MANPIDVKPANQVTTLVTYEYGLPSAPTILRYAAWTSPITYDGQVFAALPGMDVQYGKQDGSLKDSPTDIISAVVDPIDKMGGTFPPVAVTIRELKPGVDATVRKMWGGKITRVQFNYNGNDNTAKLIVSGHKTGFNAELSYTLGRFCPLIFGMNPCGFDLVAATELGTITAIVGQRVTVTGLTSIAVADWFRFGEMMVDGFPLMIHAHEVGTGNFHLVKPPPAYWLGRQVAVAPGCERTPGACAVRGQTEFFAQLGIKIPNREVRVNP